MANKEGSAAILSAGRHWGSTPSSANSHVTGRVLYTLLTDDPAQLKEMNVPPGSVGAIKFRVVSNSKEDSGFGVAYPLNSIAKYPVPNELVNIVAGPSKYNSNAQGANIFSWYYDNIHPIFDSPEHNALPNDADYKNSGTHPVTGPTFSERGDIYKLQHLPGDTIIEGRFGNAIRIGSSNDLIPESPWQGKQGNPVVVITNGQKVQTAKNISAVFEDINGDGSSIWMLSGHNITFVPASLNFDSYGTGNPSTEQKNNIITSTTQIQPTTGSLQQVDTPSTPVVDTPPPAPIPVVTETPPNPPASNELEFLPDTETGEEFQIGEDIDIPHSGEGNEQWISLLSSVNISSQPVPKLDLSGNFNQLFMVYMYLNQGPGGLKSILYYAKQGVSKIPIPSKFVTGKDKSGNYININDYMYGKKLYPNSPNSGNIGSDFHKMFGNDYTPANFLKYWQAKFNASYSIAVKNTVLDTFFQKAIVRFPVPIEYMRFVCYTESRFNNKAGNKLYKGLFSASQAQFNEVFPGDRDIYDTLKNSVVGAKMIKGAIASVGNIVSVLK